jgi:hypothetical protein
MQYIRRFPPYPEGVSNHNLRARHAVVTMDSLNSVRRNTIITKVKQKVDSVPK